jgi:hypothetical protein
MDRLVNQERTCWKFIKFSVASSIFNFKNIKKAVLRKKDRHGSIFVDSRWKMRFKPIEHLLGAAQRLLHSL